MTLEKQITIYEKLTTIQLMTEYKRLQALSVMTNEANYLLKCSAIDILMDTRVH